MSVNVRRRSGLKVLEGGPQVPPQDLNAEEAVLGALLLNADAIAEALELLRPEDFYFENHGRIFAAAAALFMASEPIDVITLAAKLVTAGVLDQVGGRARLAVLQEDTPTAGNILHYARIVREKADRRRLLAAASQIQEVCQEAALAPDEVQVEASSIFFDAVDGGRLQAAWQTAQDLIGPAMQRITHLMEGGVSATGISSGLNDLDRQLGGFQKGDLTLVAGRPAMGKSSLVFQFALHAAIEQGLPVGLFSLEMGKDQIMQRALSMQSRVDSYRISQGTLSATEYGRLVAAAGPLGDARLFVCDSPGLSEMDVHLRAKRLRQQYGIEMLLVDYLQLMRGSSSRTDLDRVQEVSSISRTLKAIARELSIPVVAACQLSRQPEGRTDKRPILSDLRETGSLEQDADVVLMVYRDDYYNRERSENPGVAELIVAKHRNGPTGSVEALWRKEYTRFDTLSRRIEVNT